MLTATHVRAVCSGLLNGGKGEREYRVTPASTLSIAQQELSGDSDDDFGDFEDAQPDALIASPAKPILHDRLVGCACTHCVSIACSTCYLLGDAKSVDQPTCDYFPDLPDESRHISCTSCSQRGMRLMETTMHPQYVSDSTLIRPVPQACAHTSLPVWRGGG